MPCSEKLFQLLKGVNPFDHFLNFREGCQHALVDLHPHFAIMFVETRIVPAFLHIVYRDNDFYAQDFSSRPLRQLVSTTAATTAAATPSAGESSAASTTISTATTAAGFLRTRFIHLERATFDVQSVEFSDSLCAVISRAKFDESEAARLAGLTVGNDAGRDRLVAFVGEELQQAVVAHAVRQTAYIKFRHIVLCHQASRVAGKAQDERD